jgi:hypothetical protein
VHGIGWQELLPRFQLPESWLGSSKQCSSPQGRPLRLWTASPSHSAPSRGRTLSQEDVQDSSSWHLASEGSFLKNDADVDEAKGMPTQGSIRRLWAGAIS